MGETRSKRIREMRTKHSSPKRGIPGTADGVFLSVLRKDSFVYSWLMVYLTVLPATDPVQR
jgi:hypothetical protein